MKRTLASACGALAIGGSLTLSAQATNPQTPTTPPSPPAQATGTPSDQRTTTLTGCLKTWDAAMGAAATGAGATSSVAARYVLTNVDAATGSPASGAASTGSASAPTSASTPGTPQAAAGRQYAIVAAAGVNLAEHVNHQVRVTGSLSPDAQMSGSRPGAATSAPPRPADPARPTDPSRPADPPQPADPSRPADPAQKAEAGRSAAAIVATLSATSVTMISNTCTAK